jgi:HAE1 family hydrophobic/amphiphilic exporter-1
VRIADLCIRRPVLATMWIGSLTALGALSLPRVGVDLMPKIEFPFVAVTTLLPGATPETVESEVTDPIEEEINTISGIDTLRSASSEGLSQVFVQFELEENVEEKAQDVRDKVARARADLPIDAEPPVVEKVDPSAAPILSVMISGPLSIRELTGYADHVVKERLQRIPGVGSVTLVGGRDREVRIWMDGDRLRSYGLSVDDVIQAIRAEHAEIPGGRLEAEGGHAELSFKTKGEVERVPDFARILVATRDGAPTLVGDVARVEDGLEDERSWAELGGAQGVALEVRRQSGRNTVAVARAVREEVATLARSAPSGVSLVVARDVSRFISASAHDVAVDIVVGALLAVLATLAFLRSVRSTLIVAVAIPTSVVATFFLFHAMGFTLNILTLMALSVSIGLLIDDAIVVLEAIHREIDEGAAPFAAASRGTDRIGLAVVAATASVLAVFLPIAFLQGMVGRFFFEYGLAISFSVAISLLVAVTVTPMLCARVLRRELHHGGVFLRLERLYARLERGYGRALAASLRHRLAVLALTAVAIAGGGLLARGVPLEFAPKVDRSEFEGVVELPLGTGIAEAKETAVRVGAALRATPGVAREFVTVGGGVRGAVNEISVYAETTPKRARSESQFEIMDHAREAMRAAAPDAKQLAVSEVAWLSGGGFTSYNVEYSIQGPSLEELDRVASAIVGRMRGDPAFLDVKSSLERGRPELQVWIDRERAADLGVPVRALAATARAAVGGLDVATFQDQGRRDEVRVRLEEAQRDELADVERLQVRAVSGALVDLANVAKLRVASGPSEIERENRGRRVTIYANTPGELPLGTAVARFEAIVAEVGLPPGYVGEWEGATERMKDTADAVVVAFGLALLALYAVLASQFESFTQPVVIMLSAPLSFVGAFVALRLTGLPMSIFAQIGLIALMGLVMKNGILLVDYANQLRAGGLSPREAILQAGPVRLRPVLMTQLATIAGMLPVALARSDAAEFRNPMGVLVIGGLLSSTLLTLIVVPAMYTLAEDGTLAARRALGALSGRRENRVAPAADSLLESLAARSEDRP